jgi:hypothetical protein
VFLRKRMSRRVIFYCSGKVINLVLLNRILTISLIGLLLFNWYGYQMLNAWLEDRATEKLQLQLDDDKYEESDLLSVKVPATHLSYYNNSEQFERVEGQIEIGGFQYSFVKRRFYNDSIEMLCIPNPEAMHFKRANYDYFKLVYDLQRPGGKKTGSHSFKRFTSVYCTVQDSYHIESLYCNLRERTSYFATALPAIASLIDDRPPKKSV